MVLEAGGRGAMGSLNVDCKGVSLNRVFSSDMASPVAIDV